MDLSIRQERDADYLPVHEVNRIAFDQDIEADLVNALRKNRDVFIPELSIVATIDDEVVAHILFTRIRIMGNLESESLALAPMAVKPAFQKRGIGGRLIESGLEKAKALNFRSVIVVGHEQYYPKFGFAPAGQWSIKAPFDVPANAFMAIELIPDGLKGVRGTVTYPGEFDVG